MKKVAYIFPGQGSQYVSMGKDFYEKYSGSKKIFDLADALLGYKISDIIFNGPKEELKKTQNCQLAIFINSVAILEAVKEVYPDIKPIVTAGLSLGEYSALVAADKITFEDALHLIKKRATLMDKACQKSSSAMAAILGLDKDQIEDVIKDIDAVYLANLNTPNQMVISGSKEGVSKACTLLKESGAKRATELNVAGAFHSPYMKYAEDNLKQDILDANFKNSNIDIVMNVTKDFPKDIENIKKNLIKQMSSSVRWYESIQKMDETVDLFIEIGSSKTLTSMNRKIKVSATSVSIDKIEDLERLKEVLNA